MAEISQDWATTWFTSITLSKMHTDCFSPLTDSSPAWEDQGGAPARQNQMQGANRKQFVDSKTNSGACFVCMHKKAKGLFYH